MGLEGTVSIGAGQAKKPMKFTLGAVSYINAHPLYWTLRDHPDIELLTAFPAQLAEGLDAGRYDAALMPVVDHLRGHGDGLLGNAIVGATGEVRSVMLFSNLPIEEVKTVALDTSSHSSVALITIILRDFYGLNPRFVHHAPDEKAMLEKYDAALLIGDPALQAVQTSRARIYDLAGQWQKFTGLSFVFAGWVARKGLSETQVEELSKILNEARDAGRQRIEAIAEAQRLLPAPIVSSYLHEAIEHTLTPAHAAGLAEFERRLKVNDLMTPL